MDAYLTPLQVAEQLGVSRKYVYDLMKDGRLPYVDLAPNTKRIARIVVADFLAERTRAAETA